MAELGEVSFANRFYEVAEAWFTPIESMLRGCFNVHICRFEEGFHRRHAAIRKPPLFADWDVDRLFVAGIQPKWKGLVSTQGTGWLKHVMFSASEPVFTHSKSDLRDCHVEVAVIDHPYPEGQHIEHIVRQLAVTTHLDRKFRLLGTSPQPVGQKRQTHANNARGDPKPIQPSAGDFWHLFNFLAGVRSCYGEQLCMNEILVFVIVILAVQLLPESKNRTIAGAIAMVAIIGIIAIVKGSISAPVMDAIRQLLTEFAS